MHFIKEQSWLSQEYPCVVIMNLQSGSRCGYVAIPKTHALYGVKYHEETSKLAPYYEMVASKIEVTVGCLMDNIGVMTTFLMCAGHGKMTRPDYLLGVHGGLTYSGGNKYPISMEDYWWFGYDCAHLNDAPDYDCLPPIRKEMEDRFPTQGIHRTLEYCFYECIKLADQLRQVDKEYKARKEILFRSFK